MNKLIIFFIYGIIFSGITGCVTNHHDINGNQPRHDKNTKTEVLLRQHQVILERAMKDADYHCKYPKLAETAFAQNIIDAGLFQNAYKTTKLPRSSKQVIISTRLIRLKPY